MEDNDEFYIISYHFDAVGDGRKGYAKDGPYNAIHVGAAAPVLPEDVSPDSSKSKF